jgi:hypothetical protein
MRVTLIALALIATAFAAVAHAAEGIGYRTVAEALKALQARSDVTITSKGGWTIVDEPSDKAVWSFTPPDHPAHPAAVKRKLVTKDGATFVETSALCQASKAACDKLMADFQELTDKSVQQVQKSVTKADSDPPSSIETQALGKDVFRLVIKTFRSNDVFTAQEELRPKAVEVCGTRNALFGKYEFESMTAIEPDTGEKKPFILRQEVSCTDGPAPATSITSTKNRDTQWRPTPEQQREVERLSYAFFAAKDTGKYAEAYAMQSDSQKRSMTLDNWASLNAKFAETSGAVQSRQLKKITWYKDPPAPEPGVYAAADYVSRFANIDIHCGYLVWHQQADGAFLLKREEQNFIDKTTQQKLKPDVLAKARAQMGCAE